MEQKTKWQELELYMQEHYRPKNESIGDCVQNGNAGKIQRTLKGSRLDNQRLKRIIQRNKAETFSEMLLRLIDKETDNVADIYKKAFIDRRHFHRIKTNPDYQPDKATVFLFALALELNVRETEKLLKTAGYAFSDSSKRDVIVKYFIEKKKYDIMEVEDALTELNDNKTLQSFR